MELAIFTLIRSFREGNFELYHIREDVRGLCLRIHYFQDKIYGATYKRVDVVFDVYRRFTLKGEARVRRGQGMRRRGTCTSKTPTNWRSFLRDDDNKTELFQFLTDRICQTDNKHNPCDERRMRHLQCQPEVIGSCIPMNTLRSRYTNMCACPRCCNRREQSSRYQS